MSDNTGVLYNEDNIRSLDWQEHIRLRPGMYIGKLGDGSAQEDGIYILLKEVIDNSIDEFVMGKLAQRIDPMPGKHSNTNVPKAIGSARQYELTGNKNDQPKKSNPERNKVFY